VSAILETLSRLNQAVDKLENTATEHEQKIARTRQQDLFTALSRGSNPTVVPFDAALFTRKLDATIQNVESLLKEG
jgi:hypothetical protein